MPPGLKRIAPILVAALVTACGSAERAPDFTLRDDGGSAWSLAQQRGKVVLLTFGFTHCADTCPATVAKLAHLGHLVPGGERTIEVAFVTVDPMRDTPAALHRFVGRFAQQGNATVVGLTGTPQQIQRVQAQYNVWSAAQPHGVAHSAVIFLIDASGRIRGIRDDEDSDSSLAGAVRPMVGAS